MIAFSALDEVLGHFTLSASQVALSLSWDMRLVTDYKTEMDCQEPCLRHKNSPIEMLELLPGGSTNSLSSLNKEEG